MNPIPLEDLLQFERGELDAGAASRVQGELKGDPEAAEWLVWVQALRAAAPVLRPGCRSETPPGLVPAPFGEIAQLAAGSLDPGEAALVRAKLLVTPDGYDLLESALEEVSVLRDAQETAPLESQPPILPGPLPGPRPASTRVPPGGTQPGIPRAIFGAMAAALFVAAGLWLWQRPPASSGVPGVQNPQSVAALARTAPMPVPRLRTGTFEAGLEAYSKDEFERAATLLRDAAAKDPDAGTIWLYLGSAELLSGNFDGATGAFDAARAKCEPSYQVEATWQLAQTRLAQNLPKQATKLLLELAGTRRAAAARDQLDAMESLLAESAPRIEPTK